MSRRRNQTAADSAGSLTETRKQCAIAAVVIVVATALTCLGVVHNDFVNLDDPRHLEMNPYFKPVSWRGLGHLWAKPYFGEYVPLTYTFLAAESRIPASTGSHASGSPFDPAVFHAGSVALHVACVWLVFLLLRRLVHRTDAALAGALLFSLHPLQVESVAWVSETRGLLAAFWSLLAIGAYLSFAGFPGNFVEHGGGATASAAPDSGVFRRRRLLHYVFGTTCLILALLAKPSAVVVPLMAGVLVWAYPLVEKRGLAPSRIDTRLQTRATRAACPPVSTDCYVRRDWRAVLVSLAPWLLIAGGFAILTKGAQGDEILTFVTPVWARPLIAGDALAFYLGKLVWPEPLAVHYDRAPLVVMRTNWLYVTWLAPAALFAATLVLKRLRPYLPAVGLWVAGLAPVLGLIPFGFQDYSTVADRYMYLPLLGPALAAACWAAGRPGKGRAAIVAALLLPLAILSHTQVTVWRDSPTLYDHTLQVNPRSWLAFFNRGVWKRDQARAALISGQELATVLPDLNDAMHDLDQALVDRPPREAGAVHNQRASIFWLRREHAQALAAYDQAIQAAPHLQEAWYNRGIACWEQQDYERAVANLSRSIDLNPEFADAYLYRGKSLRQLGQLAAALQDFSQCIQLRPEHPLAYVGRAEVRELLERPIEAIQDVSQAIALTGEAQLFQQRARLYASTGEFKQARADLDTLRRAGIEPDPAVLRAVEQASP